MFDQIKDVEMWSFTVTRKCVHRVKVQCLLRLGTEREIWFSKSVESPLLGSLSLLWLWEVTFCFFLLFPLWISVSSFPFHDSSSFYSLIFFYSFIVFVVVVVLSLQRYSGSSAAARTSITCCSLYTGCFVSVCSLFSFLSCSLTTLAPL